MLRSLVLCVLALSMVACPALSAKTSKAPVAPSLLEGVEIHSIDTPHSEMSFTVPWMGISRVRGTFQDFIGSIAFDQKGIVIGEKVDIALAVEGWKATPRDTMGDGIADSLYRQVLNRGALAVAKQYHDARAKTVDSLMTVDEGVINAVNKGRGSEALGLFNLEIESWPKNVFGYVGLGQTYAMLGNRDLAIATLEKAIAVNAEAPRAQVILKRLRG